MATATAHDAEMQKRITKHRSRRPDHWQLIEEPLALATVLTTHATSDTCILVDCLTLWLSNVLAEGEKHAEKSINELLSVIPDLPGDLVFVSSEVGLGVVPANALARRYADLLGELNQSVASHCDQVTLAVAGLPLQLKTMETN